MLGIPSRDLDDNFVHPPVEFGQLCGDDSRERRRGGLRSRRGGRPGASGSVRRDRLGLEPGPWLRDLQRRILSHDPTLNDFPQVEPGPQEAAWTGRPADVSARPAPQAPPDGDGPVPDLLNTTGRPQAPALSPERSHRREVTVMIVRANVGAGAGAPHPVGVDDLLDGIHTLVRAGVECCGGEVLASVGSATIALFDLDDPREGAARAAQLALLLRDSLDASDESRHGITIRAMVATGDLQRHFDPAPRLNRVSANGTLLDQCWEIFPQVPDGVIWVSGRTRELTLDQVCYLAMGVEELPYWIAESRSVEYPVDTKPFMDRDHEMEILQRTFHRVEQRSLPHLVTILGDHGTGKSRLLMEFCRQLEEEARAAPFVVKYRVSRSASIDPASVVAQLRSQFRETGPTDPAAADPNGPEPAGRVPEAEHLVHELARTHPVVIAADDLHLADEATLEFFERLVSGSQSGMLLIVACANEDFHRRFPQWGLGQLNSTRILLETLSVDAVARLFENLIATIGDCIAESTWQTFHRIFGDPDSVSAKRARLLRALPLIVGTNSFPGDHAPNEWVSSR